MDNQLLQVTEIELVYRNIIKPSQRPKVLMPSDAYKIFLSTWDMGTIGLVEQFKVMLLNRSNRVLGIVKISSGGINLVCVDIRLLFAAALKAAATTIIVCHNHPSGSLVISSQDRALTEKLRQAGQLLDITLSDHIIITEEGHVSFAEVGLL